MTDKELIQYLANILFVVYSDGAPEKSEERAINKISQQLGGKAQHIARAFEVYTRADFELRFPFRYSDRIRNLEDMLRVAMVDKHFDKAEQTIIKAAFKRLKLSKAQFKLIYEQAKNQLKTH